MCIPFSRGSPVQGKMSREGDSPEWELRRQLRERGSREAIDFHERRGKPRARQNEQGEEYEKRTGIDRSSRAGGFS